MNTANPFEEYTRNLYNLQREVFEKWVATLPSVQSLGNYNAPESLEQTIAYQEQVVKGSLEYQELVLKMALTTQKQMWDSYFQAVKNMSPLPEKSS
jgi:hypothetical protein